MQSLKSKWQEEEYMQKVSEALKVSDVYSSSNEHKFLLLTFVFIGFAQVDINSVYCAHHLLIHLLICYASIKKTV